MTLMLSGHKTMAWTVGIVNGIHSLSPSLLSTLWMSYKVSTLTGWTSNGLSTALTIQGSSGNFRDKLRETLNDEQKCEAFIDWMYRGFSSEVILSFLELVQFKEFVKEQIGKVCVAGDADPYDFALYDGMPKSSIIL